VPGTGSTNTGVNPGFFQEKVTSIFAEVNGEANVLGNNLRYNAGMRYATTEQTFARSAPRRSAQRAGRWRPLPDAHRREPHDDDLQQLPSGSLAYNLRPDLLARASMSKTITRADPRRCAR
jgi:outer membrane receptor protein involved in Fe transport